MLGVTYLESIFGTTFHPPAPQLMDTTKRPLLDSGQIEVATRTMRAYKHRFRYDIIGKLLLYGRMSSGEIASYLNLEESYISEQLDILLNTGLIHSEESADGVFFSANEVKLRQLKASIEAVFGQETSF